MNITTFTRTHEFEEIHSYLINLKYNHSVTNVLIHDNIVTGKIYSEVHTYSRWNTHYIKMFHFGNIDLISPLHTIVGFSTMTISDFHIIFKHLLKK